jgi:hypothetical protein
VIGQLWFNFRIWDLGGSPARRPPRQGPGNAFQMREEAKAAPSTSADSFAQPSSGWMREPKPQSAPAMTFPAPSRSA